MRIKNIARQTGMRWAAGLGALAMLAAVAGLYVALESNPAEAQSPPTGYTLNTVIGDRPPQPSPTTTRRWTAPQADTRRLPAHDRDALTTPPTQRSSTTIPATNEYITASITVPGEYTYWVRTYREPRSAHPESPHLRRGPTVSAPPTDLTASDSTNNQAVILPPHRQTVDGYEIELTQRSSTQIPATRNGTTPSRWPVGTDTGSGQSQEPRLTRWTVVSPYISLLAPPPPSQPDRFQPSCHKGSSPDEMYRLEAAVADAAAGHVVHGPPVQW